VSGRLARRRDTPHSRFARKHHRVAYDLSTLTSIYRVISFIVLGLLLLAGAYAYQRSRPPPPPDMRTVHPSQL